MIFGPKFGYKVGQSVGLDEATGLKMCEGTDSSIMNDICLEEGDSLNIIENQAKIWHKLGSQICRQNEGFGVFRLW